MCLDLGYNATLDINYYNKIKSHNGFELDNIFHINAKYASLNHAEKLGDLNNSIYNRFRRAIKGSYKSRITEENFSVEKFLHRQYSQTYFDGYWQSELYFLPIIDVIKEEFEFKVNHENLNSTNRLFLFEILNSNSVSLHIRRGDYLNIPLHNNCCTETYYSNAVQLIKKTNINAKFFIFSDDIAWCMKTFDEISPIYINGNSKESAFLDMFLMSQCKHNIIANSSFSWWSAWLNKNPDKTIIAPKLWFNDENISIEYLLPKSWIKL